MESDAREQTLIEQWLQPLSDPAEPCGKDLEHDNQFLELTKAAQGKPENQFEAGEPPDWRAVRELSEELMTRTRDLRVVLFWVRANLNLRGFAALSPGLVLIRGLMENFWEHLHPLPDPDDGDQYPRGNALALLPEAEGVFGDVRQSVLFSLRGSGELRLRAVAIALNQASPKADEVTYSKEQISQMMASAVEQEPGFQEVPRTTLANLQSLPVFLLEKLGVEAAPDLRPLIELVKGTNSLMPVPDDGAGEAADADGDAAASSQAGAAAPRAALGSVSSREDALRAIDLVCAYLEKTEPTNPAQLLLRRARRLINHNFLQLIKELAPDALNEAARVMGVDPETVNLDNDV